MMRCSTQLGDWTKTKFLLQYQNWTCETCDAVIYTDMDYHLRTVRRDLELGRVFEREREREREPAEPLDRDLL